MAKLVVFTVALTGCITVPGRVSRAYFEKCLFEGEGDSDVGDKG